MRGRGGFPLLHLDERVCVLEDAALLVLADVQSHLTCNDETIKGFHMGWAASDFLTRASRHLSQHNTQWRTSNYQSRLITNF